MKKFKKVLLASLLLSTTLMANEPGQVTIDRTIGVNFVTFDGESGTGITFGFDRTYEIDSGFGLGWGVDVDYSSLTVENVDTIMYGANFKIVGRYDMSDRLNVPVTVKVNLGYEYTFFSDFLDTLSGVSYGVSANYKFNDRFGAELGVKTGSFTGTTVYDTTNDYDKMTTNISLLYKF